MNLLALRGNAWLKLLAYLGIAAAVGYFMAFASAAIPSLLGITLLVAGICGVIIGSIWYG